MPVTSPVLLTVAIAVLLLLHTPPAAVLASVVLLPAQVFVVPVIAVCTGTVLTVSVTDAAPVQPNVPPVIL